MSHLVHAFEPRLLALWTPSIWEIILILVIGLVLFGRRLPEVGRSLGKSIVEFKKGLKDVHDEVENQSREPADRPKLTTQPDAVPRREPEVTEARPQSTTMATEEKAREH